MTGRERLKLFVRSILAAVLFYSGFNMLYRLLAKRNHAVVLVYHRIIDSADINSSYIQPGMYVTRQAFEMQTEYLFKRYRVMGLEELIEAVKKGNRIKGNTCIITFDDGWKDTYIHVLPILKKYKLSATVFLVSDYVGTNRWFWTDKVSYLLAKYLETMEHKESSQTIYPALHRMDFFPLISKEGLTSEQKIEAIIENMKQLDQDDREKTIYELKDLLKHYTLSESSEPPLLSWDEVSEMSRTAITFGSHTKSHAILTKVSKKEATGEIVESKQEIEKRLSKPCQAFCYPNGDYDDEIKRIVSEHYACALTTQHGFVTSGDDLFGLKRIGIHNDISFTRAMFACRISGILDILSL